MSPSADVRSAVLHLVAALDRYDTDAVLAAMAPDVTFVLAREAAPLRSREELREVVEEWLAVGPAVEACHAWDLEIRELGPDVATATQMLSFHLAGVPAPVRQRETLVLARGDDGRWLVVHGHRSPGSYEWAGESRLGGRTSSADRYLVQEPGAIA
ncbi:MAG: SgcJ/EcaC family oxidoreductase [Solirubrobacterales bacterium]